jgi:hypothetical protein
MDTDEDWTERLENASESQVREAIAALEHGDAEVRALACNLVYAIGIEGLGANAQSTIARLAALAQSDAKAKVKNRARIVHEGLAGDLQRAEIRRELPWLAAYAKDAWPKAVGALDDARVAVRLQVYLWWTNAPQIPADVRASAAAKLAAQCERETDDVTRRAAQLALAQVRGS